MRDGTKALVENFALMFPGRDSRELRDLALRTYRSYARDVIDFIRSLRMTPEATRRLVGRIDRAALDQAMAEGRGAIVASGHFGNWEIAGVLMRRLTPFPLSVMARSEASPAVARLRQQMRRTLAIDTIEVRQHVETALRIRERLQKNEIVAMLIDRNLGKDSVEVSFFGRPTKFLRTPALLAALSGAPIVPCFVYRDEGRLAVECGPLIRVPAEGDADANVRHAVQQVATLLEQHVRRNPQYWYQFYPFWTGEHPADG
jgi:KDO2-lipid IV(A) lauroyltransferase